MLYIDISWNCKAREKMWHAAISSDCDSLTVKDERLLLRHWRVPVFHNRLHFLKHRSRIIHKFWNKHPKFWTKMFCQYLLQYYSTVRNSAARSDTINPHHETTAQCAAQLRKIPERMTLYQSILFGESKTIKRDQCNQISKWVSLMCRFFLV